MSIRLSVGWSPLTLCKDHHHYLHYNFSLVLLKRGPKGQCRSPGYNKGIKKFHFRMEPKTTTLHPKCFKIIAMHSVCCCSLPVWRSFLKKGSPMTYFCPILDWPLGRYGQNTLTHVAELHPLTWYTWLSLKCFSKRRSKAEMALTMISLWRLTSIPNFIDCRTVVL